MATRMFHRKKIQELEGMLSGGRHPQGRVYFSEAALRVGSKAEQR